ncbi:T9SS type A sorting domain-containing protein [candidate division KSB1 bacterium]|nr:T9SS type A sorting domain-containing protein [candidate division KSB1 bacterium]
MKPIKSLFSIIAIYLIFLGAANAQYQIEELDRGLVAVATEGGVYIGWRLLATDPDSVAFNIYRGQERINREPITVSTNFLDSTGTVSDQYFVANVLDGVEQDLSKIVYPWQQNYLTIPLQRPAGGQTPDGVNYTYSPNDASVGDLDGDGEYEIVLKWDPSNSKDNSQSGYTGNVYLDGLEMDGTLLWRIDLGRNIRAGAHYTQFIVYDLDGDGIAELACKTADGAVDGLGNVIGEANADYRNSSGYIISGPEFFTIFSGETGEALVTTDYIPARGDVSSWGDDWGNRCDRFLACIAYLDGLRPSVVMCRGYYRSQDNTKGRTVLAAWDYRDGQLTSRWTFNAVRLGENSEYTGQGNHNLSVADVDFDGKDEIIYGSMAVDDDGRGLWNSGLGHGDAIHVSDIDPNRPGLEVWGIHEEAQIGSALLDAKTGEIIWGTGPGDVGRGVSANLDDAQDGMECWGGTDGLRSAQNVKIGPAPPSSNHVIWWDGDLARELLDGNNIRKYGGSHPYLLIADSCLSNNGSKSNPSLQADLFGDWREEVIWRTSDNQNLRIYTTTNTTGYRMPTLMHDRQYRLAIAWQNVAYNQPPHTSFFIGTGMFTPDSLRPPSAPVNVQALALTDSVRIWWDANIDFDLHGYNIYRSKHPDEPFEKINDILLVKTEFTDTNVENDTTYYYAVTAIDTDGNESVFSNIVEATPTVRPDTPTGVSARSDQHSALILWDSQDFNYVSRIKVYRSEASDGGYTLIDSLAKTIGSFTDSQLTEGKTYYYSIAIVDTAGVESFLSDPVVITTGSAFTMQAEDAATIGTVWLDENHIGFHGTGFANFDASNSSVEFTHMPGFGGGERTLIFRYALGNTNRTGSLTVNGVSQSLTMRNTGEWTTYVVDSVAVTLESGYNNTIRFSATGSDFGNLDEITIAGKTYIAIESSRDSDIPVSYRLHQNYPNPFNPSTTISYDLPKNDHVKLTIYNILGEEVQSFINREMPAGAHRLTVDMKNRPSGIYFYTIETGHFNKTGKMLLIR